jgi:hypothetical protein
MLNEHILEFDIAMYDTLHVHVLNCPTQLPKKWSELILVIA